MLNTSNNNQSSTVFWSDPYENSRLYKTTALIPRVLLAVAAATTIACLIAFAVCTPIGTANALAIQAKCLFLAKWIGIGACGIYGINLIRDIGTSAYAGRKCNNLQIFGFRLFYESLHTLSAAIGFGLPSIAINKMIG